AHRLHDHLVAHEPDARLGAVLEDAGRHETVLAARPEDEQQDRGDGGEAVDDRGLVDPARTEAPDGDVTDRRDIDPEQSERVHRSPSGCGWAVVGRAGRTPGAPSEMLRYLVSHASRPTCVATSTMPNTTRSIHGWWRSSNSAPTTMSMRT